MKHITQNQLVEQYSQAYLALPIPYQNDSCLDFYQDCNRNLCCGPKEDQVSALGEWEAVFDIEKGEWVAIV
jgi:hypothetical protein